MEYPKLTDSSIMPFGKYGVGSDDPQKMANVPAWYLLKLDGSTRQDVQAYIDDNRDVLEQEAGC
jgi:hypothetical protein